MPSAPTRLALLVLLVALLGDAREARALVASSDGGSQPQVESVELAAVDLEGTPRSLRPLRDRVVVVNFWATWCIPCRKEMPILERVARDYSDRGVVVVGASADDATTRDRVPDAVRSLGMTFPVWLGTDVADMQRFGLGSELPATAIVDRGGAIVARIRGVVDEQDLRTRIDWLLSDRTQRQPWKAEPAAGRRERTEVPGGASLVPS